MHTASAADADHAKCCSTPANRTPPASAIMRNQPTVSAIISTCKQATRMVSSAATTVTHYLEQLPPERRAVVAAVRDAINAHLPPGYVESMAFGMIAWVVPLSRYPDTYNRQPLGYVALAAQKNNYSLYLNCAYGDAANESSLREAYARAGKKLDMGKSCVRFKTLDDLLLDEITRLIASVPVDAFIAHYEAAHAAAGGRC